MPERPPPPPLVVVIASMEAWLGRLDEAIGEPDPAERERLLHHVRNNMANGIAVLRWYAGG